MKLQKDYLAKSPSIETLLRLYPNINSLKIKLLVSLVYIVYGYLYYPKLFSKRIYPVFAQQLKMLKIMGFNLDDKNIIKNHFSKKIMQLRMTH